MWILINIIANIFNYDTQIVLDFSFFVFYFGESIFSTGINLKISPFETYFVLFSILNKVLHCIVLINRGKRVHCWNFQQATLTLGKQ